MDLQDREHVTRKIEKHLRKMTRRLIKIDSEEEVLRYLSDTFRTQLYCDFVSVVFIENDEYVSKVWSGKGENIMCSFPLKIDKCNDDIMKQSLTNEEAKNKKDDCLESFKLYLLEEKIIDEAWLETVEAEIKDTVNKATKAAEAAPYAAPEHTLKHVYEEVNNG